MDAISQTLEQLDRNFALHSETTKGMCLQNIISENEGATSGKKIRAHRSILDPPPHASTLSKHIGPTLHVEPNNNKIKQTSH